MRTLLLSVLVLTFGLARAQFAFPTDNATWVNTLYTMVNPPPFPTWQLDGVRNYCANGVDTVINAVTYTKLERCSGGYKGAFREVGGQVLYVPGGTAQEYVLYDFSLQAGESTVVYFEPTWDEENPTTQEVTVSNIDINASLGGRKVLYLQDGATWIEGIGPTWGLFTEPWINVSNYIIALECMSYQDTVRYPALATEAGMCDLIMDVSDHEFSNLTLYPNPTLDGRVTVSGMTEQGTWQITVFGADGRTVLSQRVAGTDRLTLDLGHVPSGVYMVDMLMEREHYRAMVLRQ